MQRIIICDDDRQVCASLATMIDQVYDCPHRVRQVYSWDALRDEVLIISPGEADIVFLDIQLGADNGILVSRQLRERYPHIRFIYITGYIQFSEAIFHGFPTAFLVKPIKPASLLYALEKATAELDAMEDAVLPLKVRGGELRSIPLRQIRYIESTGRLALIHTDSGPVECYRRLGELEEQLADGFVRCHQSFLVNLGHVKQIQELRLLLYTGEAVPISRVRLRATKEKLMRYAGEGV
ncbi:MAG: LytTR family DNA-binding domain-containing protein [Clostridiales bacterium]|nr:LytTR family DNA-binding domain-containing protein [Clostridiales bacterium]